MTSAISVPVQSSHPDDSRFRSDVEITSGILKEDLVSMLTVAIKGLKIANISSVFFNNAEGSCVWAGEGHTSTVEKIAVPLLAWKICKVFRVENDEVEQRALDNWVTALQSTEASAMFVDMMKQWLMDKFGNEECWNPLFAKSMDLFRQRMMAEQFFLNAAVADFRGDAFLKEVEDACNRPEKIGSGLMVYGNDVKTWISNPQGVTNYGMQINWDLFKTEFVPNSGVGGCFLAGTKILVDNEQTVDIERVHNRNVIGNNGSQECWCSNVELTTKVERMVYGFNDVSPFFTGDHAFLTQEGWKAIDPQTAKLNYPYLTVRQLEIGDSIKKLSSAVCPSKSMLYEWEVIKKFSSNIISKGQTVYGIQIPEGLVSCHANNYVAHANLLGDIFRTPNGYYEDLFSVPESPLKHCVPLEDVCLVSLSLLYPQHNNEQLAVPEEHLHIVESLPSNIRVVRGRIYRNGVLMDESNQISDHQLAWRMHLRNNVLEEGVIHFHPDRLSGYGKVMLSTGDFQTTEPYVFSFNALLSQHYFDCELFTSDMVKYEGVKLGLQNVHLGYKEGPTYHSLTCKIDGIQNYLEMVELGKYMNIDITRENQAIFEIHIPPEHRPLFGFAHLSGVFIEGYTGFTGRVVAYDPTKLEGEGESFTWTGRLNEHYKTNLQTHFMSAFNKTTLLSEAAFLSPVTYALTSDQNKAKLISFSKAAAYHPSITNLKNIPSAPLATPALRMTRNLEQLSESLSTDLNLTDLINIPPPDQTEVHTLTFSMVKQSMLFEIPDKWRTDLLGVSKPDLLHGMDKLADLYKNMLVEKYAVGYLSHGMANGTPDKGKFSDSERNKLLFFWAGGKNGCLSNNENFSNMYFSSSLIAFDLLTPKLNNYLKSADPEAWAKLLFDYLVNSKQLDVYAKSTNVNSTTIILQKQCMVLQCLAPTKKYATEFYTKVVLRNLQKRSDFFIGTNKMDMMAFIDESNKLVIEKVLAKDPHYDADYVKDMDKVIRDAAKELKIKTEGKTNKDLAWLISKQIHGLMSQFVSIWKEKSGTLWWRSSEAISSFFMRNPNLFLTAKLVSCLFGVVSWGLAFYGTIRTFMGWKTLSTDQKVAAVFNAVNFAVASISRVKDIVADLCEIKDGFYNTHFVRRWVAGQEDPEVAVLFETQALELNVIVNEGATIQESIAEAVSRSSSSEEEITATTEAVQEEFSVLEKSAQVTTVLALVASSVALGFRIYNDLKDGQPVIVAVMDILQEVVMGLQISIGVMKVLDMAPSFIDMASLPVIGSVLAIAGIIMYFVSVFSEKDKTPPQTPAEKFIIENSKPFLKTLRDPSKKWLHNYKKHNTK